MKNVSCFESLLTFTTLYVEAVHIQDLGSPHCGFCDGGWSTVDGVISQLNFSVGQRQRTVHLLRRLLYASSLELLQSR